MKENKSSVIKDQLEAIAFNIKNGLFENDENIPKKTLFLELGIILASVTFVLAILIVPNNVDSMCYHLPRVCSWIENKSVAYYPVEDIRQLYYFCY